MGTGETGEDEKDRGIGFRSGGRDSMREKEGGGERERLCIDDGQRNWQAIIASGFYLSFSLSLSPSRNVCLLGFPEGEEREKASTVPRGK